MSDKYSSDKGMQKLFEGFRNHTEEVQQLDEEQLDEGLMDTLKYLFTGKTPSELDLIQRELDKAKANLGKPSIKGGESPARKTARHGAAKKLAQLKKAKGMPITPITEMYEMSQEAAMVSEKVYELIDLINVHGSDLDLVDAYISLMRALKSQGINLQALVNNAESVY